MGIEASEIVAIQILHAFPLLCKDPLNARHRFFLRFAHSHCSIPIRTPNGTRLLAQRSVPRASLCYNPRGARPHAIVPRAGLRPASHR